MGDLQETRKQNSFVWWACVVSGGCALLLILGLLLPKTKQFSQQQSVSTNPTTGQASSAAQDAAKPRWTRISKPAVGGTPEEIVAAHVAKFGQSRREIVRRIARLKNKEVPAEIEQFFDAIEAGNWEEINRRWDAMAKRSGQYEGSRHDPALNDFWPAVLEAYGAAEQAHEWPAQKLLDYGEAILGALEPGMVYVGGTDEGRFIPTMLNETSYGGHHIILTQNALADGRYVEYMQTLYGDRFSALTPEDSERGFKSYIQDAEARLKHDQEFPDEPKQIRPGEDVRMVDGKVQVSGAIAVFDINERLLKTIMEKNPDLRFALQESYPLRTTYSSASPLGPIMELGAPDGQSALTPQRVADSMKYWQSTVQDLLADPQVAGSETALKSFAHLAVGQANLFAGNNYPREAEQGFRLAIQLAPMHGDAHFNLADLLRGQGRVAESEGVLQAFSAKYPEIYAKIGKSRGSATIVGPASASEN